VPKLLAGRPGAPIAAVDLSAPVWQLRFAATAWDGTPCFSLVYSYPPSQLVAFRPADSAMLELSSYAFATLLRVPVQFAENTNDMNKVVQAANDSETEEIALQRTTEAFTLFRNNARIRAQDVEATAKEACEVVKVAWSIRLWLFDGAAEAKTWELLNTKLMARP
jgi:hypothetical protein